MQTFLSQSCAHRGAANSHTHLCAMSPALLSITTAALLILTVPGCKSAPAEVVEVTTAQKHMLNQMNAVCSTYLSSENTFWASDSLADLCVLMLVQKSKELKAREYKRAELQGPGGIQSRGYFLYRPRNGRRSSENE